MGNKIIYKGYTVGETTQVSIMPTASVDNSGAIVQYVGATNANYINGRFYRCVSDGASTPTYSWEEVDVGTGEVVDTVKNGNMKAVTSNAVYDYLTPTEILTTGTTVSQGSATIDFIRCMRSGNTVTIYGQLSEAALTNESPTTTKLTLPNAVPAAVILTTGAIGYWGGEVDEGCYCHIGNGRTLTFFCNIDKSPVSGVHVRFSVTYICE